MVVRGDIPRGIQAASIVHAAGESSPGGLPSGTHAICLVAANEAALREVARRLRAAGIAHVEIDEPDPPFDGAMMAVGLVPARKEDVRRHLSSLPLLK